MPTPVTASNENDLEGASESGTEHLEAAEKFLASQPVPQDVDPQTTEQKPAPVVAKTEPAAKTPGLLSQVLKVPGAQAAEKPADQPVVEDVAKGLQEPRADSKSHAGWQELKKRANEERVARVAAEKKAQELEAKAKSAPASEASNARIQELESQNKMFSERLKVLDLKAHPEFEEKYVKPQNEAKAALEAIVKGDESDVKVEDLLALKGRGKMFNKAVSEALDSLTPYARVQFQSALERYIAADIGAQQALSKADEFLKSAKQNTGARSRAVYDQESAGFRDHYLPMQVDEKADEATKQQAAAYNAALAEVSKTAETLAFGSLDERTAARVANEAALYRFTRDYGMPRIDAIVSSALAERDAKIQSLEAQVKSLTAASPRVDGGAGIESDGAAPEESDHLAAARRHLAGTQ
jgi:uncharacterized membrane protein